MRFFLISIVALVACGAPQRGPVPTVLAAAGGDGDLRIAELGTCALDNGQKIEECRLGYRTYGKLDAKRSNVIVWPTWFTGTTADLSSVPKDWIDTGRFYLVLVDALANGVSSAPSSSRTQPRLSFPKVSIHDMVESERRLLKEVLHVEKPYAVVGISMGGMQAFEWAVSHPEEPTKFVSIVGSPQLTAQDLLLWNAELDLLDGSKAYADGGYSGRPKIPALQELHWLNLHTPAERNLETSRAQFAAFKKEKGDDTTFDWNDWHRQLEAMIAHDVARNDGGDIEKAAKRVRAKTLIVVAEQDHMVNPGPAKTFAAAMNAKLMVSVTPCGHSAPDCDPAIPTTVKTFLAE